MCAIQVQEKSSVFKKNPEFSRKIKLYYDFFASWKDYRKRHPIKAKEPESDEDTAVMINTLMGDDEDKPLLRQLQVAPLGLPPKPKPEGSVDLQ
jgi:hypothetical protein